MNIPIQKRTAQNEHRASPLSQRRPGGFGASALCSVMHHVGERNGYLRRLHDSNSRGPKGHRDRTILARAASYVCRSASSTGRCAACAWRVVGIVRAYPLHTCSYMAASRRRKVLTEELARIYRLLPRGSLPLSALYLVATLGPGNVAKSQCISCSSVFQSTFLNAWKFGSRLLLVAIGPHRTISISKSRPSTLEFISLRGLARRSGATTRRCFIHPGGGQRVYSS